MTETFFSPNALPGPADITRREFANGAVLLTRPNFNSPAVAIRGYLPPGSVAESPDKIGLANFLSSMLMAGTRQHEFRELHDQIESMGASLAIGSGGLATAFSGQCLREDLPRLLAILWEVLDQPSFPERQFKRIKTQTMTALAIQAQDTAEMANQAFDRSIYGTHPYAHPDIGYAQTVQAITRLDLEDFHQRYFGPKGLVLAISGGVAPDEAVQAFEQTLGAWQKPDQQTQPDLPEYQPISHTLREHVPLAEKSQTDLVIGTIAPKTMGPDYHACQMGNDILGQFGMMGRIGESVREKAGLAYYVQSEMGGGLGPSIWQVVAGVNPDNLDKAIQLILDELKRFTSEPVSEEELADVRSQTIGRLPLSMESNGGVAHALLNFERFNLDLNYLHELPETLASVTAADILQATQRYWDLDKIVITSAGRALT
ncbi:MAG: pitrilysin family protein [Anaerolineaceae bacterium]